MMMLPVTVLLRTARTPVSPRSRASTALRRRRSQGTGYRTRSRPRVAWATWWRTRRSARRGVDLRVRHHVAHATRGRLRVRYPVPWLRRRRSAVEARLRGLTGVRAVLSSTVTGSIIIDYDPFALAEQRLIAELGELSD